MAGTNSKKGQVQYKKNYEKHVRFEPGFAAGDYAFAEGPQLLAFGADCIAYGRYLKLLSRHTGPYRVINVGP